MSVSPDELCLHGLEVRTRIGVYAWEREVHQPLQLDLDLRLRPGAVASVAEGDDLAKALDYTILQQRVESFAATSATHLLETFAEQLASCLLAEYPLVSLRLVVCKPAALPGTVRVRLVIERHSAG